MKTTARTNFMANTLRDAAIVPLFNAAGDFMPQSLQDSLFQAVCLDYIKICELADLLADRRGLVLDH